MTSQDFQSQADDANQIITSNSTASTEKTPEEQILELFTGNIGAAIAGGLRVAGENNGQPALVMDSIWNTHWFAAQEFMESLMARADATAASFARLQTGGTAGVPFRAPTQPAAPSIPDQFAGRTPIERPPNRSGSAQTGPTKINTTVMKLDPKLEGGRDWYLGTTDGIQAMEQEVWDWYRGKVSFDIGDLRIEQPPSGGGRRGFTAAEIRNRFDLDELTRTATNIFRSLLLTDDVKTRPMAKAYIEAVVATKGEKEIDFVEFITKKAEATDRFASIYRSKPGSMTASQYLLPYFQAAQVAGPGEASAVAIEGAQFGADPATFNARLRRTDAVTGSSSFINELQAKLTELNGVFKG